VKNRDGQVERPEEMAFSIGFLLELRYSSCVDVSLMLVELRTELEQINAAIGVIERLAMGSAKRRGRPPAWMADVSAPKKRGRPPGSKNRSKTRPQES